MLQLDQSDVDQLRQQFVAALADPTQGARRAAYRAAFSPSLSYGRHFGPPAPTARPAAVMILLEPRETGWSIPLTVRPDHLPDHPGQVSLPGGRLETGESYQQAAEREFCEELGCQAFPGEVLGELSPLYVYNSDYYVKPFVAVCEQQLEYIPCPHEVERIVHLPLQLLHSQPPAQQDFARGWARWTAPIIEFEETVVWGATAIILAEVAALVQT